MAFAPYPLRCKTLQEGFLFLARQVRFCGTKREWVVGARADCLPAERQSSFELKSAVNGLQNARLEGLTRLPTASTVKARDNERKKDSDRPALEEE